MPRANIQDRQVYDRMRYTWRSDYLAENMRRWKLAKKGTTPQEFETTVNLQSGMCAICTDPVELVADHDHATGHFRGALCRRCNLGLGYFRDDPALLHNAVFYLGHGVGQDNG